MTQTSIAGSLSARTGQRVVSTAWIVARACLTRFKNLSYCSFPWFDIEFDTLLKLLFFLTSCRIL